MKKTPFILLFAFSCAFVLTQSQAQAASRVIKALDTDKDGTVDLPEARAAGEATFAKLEKDSDGTVDQKEVGSRLSKKDFAAADPDSDGTLTKDEYLALVESRFKAADGDAEGTLDQKELQGKAGQALLRLIR